MKSPLLALRRGFTLVEVALAIVIVSVVVLAAVGLLLPSQRAIDEVLSGGQATRLRQEIEKEFSVLRGVKDKEYFGPLTTPFEKAYVGIKDCTKRDKLFLAFFYRAEKGATTKSGRLKPITLSPSVDLTKMRAGEDYVVQAAFMSLKEFQDPENKDPNDPDNASAFATSLEGGLFVVKLIPLEGLVSETQIPPEEKTLKPLPPVPPNSGRTYLADFLSANNSDAYPLAVIPAAAEFYQTPDVVDPTVIFDGNAKPKKAQTRPVITLNVGFNR